MTLQKHACAFASVFVFAASASAATPAGIKLNNAGGRAAFGAFQSNAGGLRETPLLALWDTPDGPVRQMNVQKVTNPKTGVYCITAVKKLNVNKVFPVVTAEYTSSHGNALAAYVEEDPSDCGKHPEFEVVTFDSSSGTPQPSNLVSFYLLIP